MNIIKTIMDSGIIGAGGAGFPTHIKLNQHVDYYIINACECEPLLEVDKFLLRNSSNEIIKTIDYIADFLGAKNRCIAIKNSYKEEISFLKKSIEKQKSKIYFKEMDSFYPAGDEHIVVYEVTGKPITERGLPLENSCVVNNVSTILNIHDAIFKSEKLIYKYISVTGEVSKPLILKVPIGTPVRYILDNVNITCDDYAIIMGGPMMGKIYSNDSQIDNLYISKRNGGIIILPKNHYLVTRSNLSVDKLKSTTKNYCIQCKFCTEFCPRYMLGHNIRPHHVMKNLLIESEFKTDEEYIEAFGDAVNCSECGVCELFACPMFISPRQVNQYVKSQIRKKGLNVPKKLDPIVHKDYDYRKIDTNLLIARLELTKYKIDKKIEDFLILNPSTVHISLSEHIGKPSVSCVNVGDMVTEGQLIAKCDGDFSINLHSSLNGKVIDVKDAVVIERR